MRSVAGKNWPVTGEVGEDGEGGGGGGEGEG
jgi:hypothetical protein